MSLQDWSDLAQVVGNIAIVATLVALFVQVRASTAAFDREARQRRLDKLTTPFFQSPELARISAKINTVQGMSPLQTELMETFSLTAEESILWVRHLIDNWITLQIEFQQGGRTLGAGGGPRAQIQTVDNKIFWKHYKHRLDPDFVRFVEGGTAT